MWSNFLSSLPISHQQVSITKRFDMETENFICGWFVTESVSGSIGGILACWCLNATRFLVIEPTFGQTFRRRSLWGVVNSSRGDVTRCQPWIRGRPWREALTHTTQFRQVKVLSPQTLSWWIVKRLTQHVVRSLLNSSIPWRLSRDILHRVFRENEVSWRVAWVSLSLGVIAWQASAAALPVRKLPPSLVADRTDIRENATPPKVS